MKRLLILSVVLCLAIHSSFANEPVRTLDGYGKTYWGMTVDEVIASEAPRAHKLKKDEIYKDETSSVVIEDLQIGSSSFDAFFLFDNVNKKLVRVLLKGKENKNNGINLNIFDRLEKLLTEKYGQPTYKNSLGRNAEGEHEITWNLGLTKLELSHTYIPQILTQVVVSYEPAAKAKAAASDL